jgi:signal transduction histidine kinase
MRTSVSGSVTALRWVLTGRDEPPAWRSAARRRVACLAAWLGWALVLVLALLSGSDTQRGMRRHEQGNLAWATAVQGHLPSRLAIELAVSVAILLLPRFPLLGWRIAWLGVLVGPLVPGQNEVDTGCYAIVTLAFVVAGLRYGPPRLWWMAVLMLIPVWLWTPPLFARTRGDFLLGSPQPDWTYPVRLTLGLAVLCALVYAAGRWRRDRAALATQAREAQRQAAEAQRQAAEARQQRERGAVLEERARIAREMHDVVAHHMSMIAVQAETAPYRVAGLPEGALVEFAALSQSAREALTDMRRLLGVLRGAEGEASEQVAALLPQPGLGDVDGLVDSVRRAGADVAFEMSVAEGEVPAIVGLTAYRIVQESLSNAGRHAPGAPIRVAVRQGALLVQVDVDNGPARLSPAADSPAAGPPGGGHGLAGMRERVALLGGRLSAGPRAGGGFAVRAELPVAAALDAPVIRASITGGHWHQQPGQVPVSGDPA